jgi:hypothetical protein
MNSQKFYFFKKILSSFLIFTFILSSTFLAIPAKKADAQWVVHDPLQSIINAVTAGATPVSAGSNVISSTNSVVNILKEYVLKPIAWAIAQQMLQSITTQTVKWINSGFNGNPAYITNPDQFFLNVGDSAVTQALGKNGGLLNKICTPFQPQIRLALVQQYINENQLGSCSLGQVVKNYDAWTQNFENGGWNSWFAVTQNTQNNPYGAYLAAQNELQQNIYTKQNQKTQQLNWGQGFLSYQKCTKRSAPSAPTNNGNVTAQYDEDGNIVGVTGNAAGGIGADGLPTRDNSGIATSMVAGYGNGADAFDAEGKLGGNCDQAETVTPGSVIKDSLGKSLGASVDKLNLINDINQIASALLQQAFKAVVGSATSGLRGLTSSSSGNSVSPIDQLLKDSQAQTNKDIQNAPNGLPSSVQDVIDTNSGTTPLTPTIDENALANQIKKTADTITTDSNKNLPPDDKGLLAPDTKSATTTKITSVQGYIPQTLICLVE